jgi:hypothetical protein
VTRLLVTLDRLAGVVLALVLVALGLVLLDWRLGTVLNLPTVAHIGPVLDLVKRVWWPVVAAVAAVLLVLVGLRWLFAHLPRVRNSEARLSASSGTGRLKLDTPSVARAGAAALTSEMVLPEARGRVREVRGRPLVQLDAHCTRDTHVSEVRDRAAGVAHDVSRAFPSGDLPLRVVVGAPRTRVRDRARRTRARVQ